MNITLFLEHLYSDKKRKNGEFATSHFFAVKDLLKSAGVREDIILDAALLHDVMEDFHFSRQYMALKFGDKVAKIVDLLSKNRLWNTSYCRMKSNMDEVEASWVDYPEAVLIKMADRLHNLITVEGFDIDKQKDYLDETFEIMIPIFERAVKINNGHKPAMKTILKQLKAEAKSIETRLNK